MRVMTVGSERRFEQVYSFGEEETDDRGMFRLFGIPPGEYVLRAHAEPWAMMHGAMSVHEMTPADIQWARSQMQGGASVSSVSAEPPPRRPRAYAPSYYPGTSSRTQAAVVRLGPGEERTGLDITTQAVATSRVRGTVEFDGSRDGDVPNVSFVEVDNTDSFYGFGFTHGWTFSLDGVPPGRYSVTASLEKSKHFGTAEVVVSGQDQNVQIRLREPLALRGVLSFRDSTQAVPKGLRVELAPLGTRGTLTVSPEAAAPGADGSFEVKGIMPGRYRVNPQIPGAGAWSVESIKAGDLDVTAVPLVLTADASTPPLVITLTDQPTDLSGRFEDASGRPATDYFIIVFSPDERAWYRNSRAIAQTRPGTDGRFSVRALPPGNYLLAAVTDVERDQRFSPDFLKELVPSAVKVTLGAGEKKVQDLRIAK